VTGLPSTLPFYPPLGSRPDLKCPALIDTMATQKCPLCSYHGRSDHLRRHLKKHARTIAIDCPNDWIQLSGMNLYVKSVQRILPTGEPFGATKYPEGVCFDCCKYLPLNTHDLTKYSSHVCAEKEERPHRKGVAPANKKSDEQSQAETVDLQEESPDSKIPEVDMSDMFDQCMSAVTKIRLPAERLVLREKLRSVLRSCKTDNTDEETGKVDWPALFIDFTRALATEYAWTVPVEAPAAPSVTSPAPVATSHPAPPPVAPAPPASPATWKRPSKSSPVHEVVPISPSPGGRELR
jgi:hypothetical protein